MRGRVSLICSLCLVLLASWGSSLGAATGATGRITGRVTAEDGEALSGVEVVVEGLSRAPVVTDSRGRFACENLPEGTYSLTFTLGSLSYSEESVTVRAGGTTELRPQVSWTYSLGETLTVVAASRRRERIVDAPAAVSVITEKEIEREAATGQLPKLLESTAGAEITQSGLYDFKFNARGTNISINRRVAVLIDGRDPSFPFLGAQEWAAITFPLDDLESAELIRGPSSALYGASAFNGILNLITKAPSTSRGGFLRLTAGELATAKVDFRHAGQASESLYYKVMAGYTESDDFSRSRNETLEYSKPCTLIDTVDCLFLEAAPLALDRNKIGYLSARLDRDFTAGRVLTVEGGVGNFEGYVFSSPAARFQLVDTERPWGRLNLTTSRWNLLLSLTARDAEALTLSNGLPSFLDTYRGTAELRRNWEVADGRGRLVAGASATHEKVDSADSNGNQTLIFAAEEDDQQSAFAQLDYELNDRLKLVVAGRFDDSSFHDVQFSPKAALVWALRPSQTFRLSYNEGFLRPNYGEYFVRVPLGLPLDLSPFEGFCAPAGVACGFDRGVALLGVGNENLTVETIRSIEAGLNSVVNDKGFLTVDIYWTEIEDFVLQFVPLVGTRLGRVNPDFGPYAPPAELPAGLAAALLATLERELGPFFPFLSNEKDGRPIFALRSLINFGRVETRGVELAFDYPLSHRLGLRTNYSFLDFEVRDELALAPLRANGPTNKLNLGVVYAGDRLVGSLHWRWVESFPWAEGVLIGRVPSYSVVNATANYELPEGWEVGLTVSNLLNDKHYELFSGDILERRALAHVSRSW